MAAKESYREKQDNELEVLLSIFDKDVKDLRITQEKWLPLDIKIALLPQQDSRAWQPSCSVSLHVQCPKNYPKVTPKLFLEDVIGLKDEDASKLLTRLNKEAYRLSKLNEVMIYELCTMVQTFLSAHNQPLTTVKSPTHDPKMSLYDEMQKNKLDKDKRKMDEVLDNEKRQQERLQSELLRRKEQIQKESRMRRNTTTSESSPRHLSSSNSEDVHEVCDEHKRSEVIVIQSCGRKIQRGACLGHSQKGCINFAGIDMATGKHLYVTEWSIKHSDLEAKRLLVDDVVRKIEHKVQDLAKFRHKNIIGYECVLCNRRKDHIQVFLVQEFVQGISLFSISGGLGWCVEGVSMVTKSVLQALIFLHNNGISHGNLLDTTVFMDNSGNIRVTDFSFVPYLQELISGEPPSADLPSLGTLIESMITTPHLEMRDFIARCNNERTLSAHELLDDPFLFPTFANVHSTSSSDQKPSQIAPHPPQQALSVLPFLRPMNISLQSRLQTEFEIIASIGKGGFGEVLKARNILDNRNYAIKKIPVKPNQKKWFFKKMTREVEVLSRLNHENVVRYYGSWTETASEADLLDEDNESDGSVSRVAPRMVKTISKNHLGELSDDSSSDEDDDDFSIEFQYSNGEIAEYDESEESKVSTQKEKGSGDSPETYMLYIQMEFCEKSTLRTAIDGGLYKDKERLWRYFRGIIEGLAHIHQQGIIHRDLKPVNVFLDSRDQVKIGDFGLATSTLKALQQNPANQSILPKHSFGDSQTGQVGTALYNSPESVDAKLVSVKVDIYSAGIIFFEMISPPLATGMERVVTLNALRKPEIAIPSQLTADQAKNKNEVKLLKWLLDHDHNKRPTAEELLQSELVPPPELDVVELKEIVRNVLQEPQSSNYRYLVTKCLQQESDMVCQLTYHHKSALSYQPIFENVKNKIVKILRKHGAIDVGTPLLTPYNAHNSSSSAVKLMCQSGGVVCLPHDLRQPFLLQVVHHNIRGLRRYSIGRIYHERRQFNLHPKQFFECAFDIIAPTQGTLLTDAEPIAIVNEIVCEFETIKSKNVFFRINQTNLLRALFIFHRVPADRYKRLQEIVTNYLDEKTSKLITRDAIKALVPGAYQLADTLLMNDIPTSTESWMRSPILKSLKEGSGESKQLANAALRDLETVIKLCQLMGVSIPINLCVGLSSDFDCSRPGCIIWQLMAEMKPGSGAMTALASGGRFDNAIEDIKATLQSKVACYSVGFSLAMDKIVSNLVQDARENRIVDLVIILSGNRPPLKDVIHILKLLWSADTKCCFVESCGFESDEQIARKFGADHILLMGDDGIMRLKSWQLTRFDERVVNRVDIEEYLKKNLIAEASTVIETSYQPLSVMRNNSITNIPAKNLEYAAPATANLNIQFVVGDKLAVKVRKRLENQIEQKLDAITNIFNKKGTIFVFVVELVEREVRSLVNCIEPHPTEQSKDELEAFLDKFPKHKRNYLRNIYDDITECIQSQPKSQPWCVAVFSIPDTYYRLIL